MIYITKMLRHEGLTLLFDKIEKENFFYFVKYHGNTIAIFSDSQFTIKHEEIIKTELSATIVFRLVKVRVD